MKEQAREEIQKEFQRLEQPVGVKTLKIIKMTQKQPIPLRENVAGRLNQKKKSKWNKCENK